MTEIECKHFLKLCIRCERHLHTWGEELDQCNFTAKC